MENREEIKKKIESMSKEELIDFYMEKDSEIAWYKEQLALMNKLRYSTKSEKTICGQLNLFNEVEDIHDIPVEDTEQVKVKKKKSREANFSKLPTKTIHHELEDKHCEICGTEMSELAPQVIDVLKYQPARYVVERHVVHQYICPTCTDENLEAEIIIAEGAPTRLIKGSAVSPSVVAGIAFNKYVSGTPLYRQEQELKRKKVEISRANMSNWLMKCGELLDRCMSRYRKTFVTYHIYIWMKQRLSYWKTRRIKEDQKAICGWWPVENMKKNRWQSIDTMRVVNMSLPKRSSAVIIQVESIAMAMKPIINSDMRRFMAVWHMPDDIS